MNKKRLTLIAIDDDAADLKLLRRHLSAIPAWEVDLSGFSDWSQAKPALAKTAVDVVFLDYLLGGKTGLDVVRELRDAGDMRPLIVLTGQDDASIAAEISRAGADDYLVKKGLNADMLRRSIQAALDRHYLRREKAILTEQLNQSQTLETVGTLAGGLAHDFNNMLTAILGYLELAILKSKECGIEKELKKASDGCRQMAELVERLLTFSRRHKVDKAPLDLTQLIQEAVTVLRHTIGDTVRFSVDLPPSSIALHANGAMLQQVIFNLCQNAAEAMPEGGAIRVKAASVMLDQDLTLRYPDLTPGRHVLLEIQDNGVGMDKATMERIFEPFFTTKKLGAKRGTGLGMALVWHNVKTHNGVITVYSEPGRGTTFRIYFPGELKGKEPTAPPERQTDIPRGTEAILLVEDEQLVQELAVDILQRLGYRVYIASDGLMALDTWAEMKTDIDLIILDISMPRMDGMECIKQLREKGAHQPVLFASGHDMTVQAEMLTALGAQGIIQKPFRLTDLARRIRTILDAPEVTDDKGDS